MKMKLSKKNLQLVVMFIFTAGSSLGGNIKMSASDYDTDLLSEDKHHIVIKYDAVVKLVAKADDEQNGKVSVTYTHSDGVVQVNDEGKNTKKQTTEFILATSCIGKENWIEAKINHTDSGVQCTTDKTIRYYVYIPELVFNLAAWSPDNTLPSRFTSRFPSNPPPIGTVVLYDNNTYAGIPYEYIVSVAPGILANIISPSNLDVHETGNVTRTDYDASSSPWSHTDPAADVKYRDIDSYGSDGTDNTNPIRYADDCPGPQKATIENDMKFNSANFHPTSTTWTASLTSNPVYKTKDVGKPTSHSFTITCDANYTGSTITSFTWH